MSNKKSIVAAATLLLGVAAQGQIVQQPQVIPAVTPQAAQIPFGPVLDVIPYVSADGYSIQMSIVPTLTEFLGYDTENSRQFQTVIGNTPTQPTPLPGFRVRQITTSAIVWDGQTVVLGGLIAENVTKTKDKVPVLGDIPLLGRLFRSESSSSTKKNLVVFVTPVIIDPAGNRVHTPDNLPYDPNTVPEQKPVVP
ncbi:MAG: type and secretion system protein [Verrucomicrobiales bacterium]|jgi:general secretion pathway protein D|nr:type and secretion system protein [Verrucomicrobiales bacterium]